jgi:anhydro-N-acetylmuramic acid kinase
MPATPDLYIGLMSGTSLDGADGVVVDFSGDTLRVIAAATEPFSNPFRAELLALNSPTHNELHRAALAGNQIAAVYATVVNALLAQAGIQASHIQAIGAHGQTVRHQPQRTSGEPAGAGYTLQLNNPALLAELTGIDVAADFRSRDGGGRPGCAAGAGVSPGRVWPQGRHSVRAEPGWNFQPQRVAARGLFTGLGL